MVTDTSVRFLSLGQFARAAEASKATVHRALLRGDIPGEKTRDGNWAIAESEVAKYKKQATLPCQGRRAASPEQQKVCDVSLWELIVAAERARADAAERRCDVLIGVLHAAIHRG